MNTLQLSLIALLSAPDKIVACLHNKIITHYFSAKGKDLLVWQTLAKEYLQNPKNLRVKKMLIDEFEDLMEVPAGSITYTVFSPYVRIPF